MKRLHCLLIVFLLISLLTGCTADRSSVPMNDRWANEEGSQALAFGIGFGAIEAFLLNLIEMLSARAGLLAPDALPISTFGGLANNIPLAMGLILIFEHLSVIFAHSFACVLIFHAINNRQAKWSWFAILFKTLLDAPAGFAIFRGAGTVSKLWSIQGTVALFGLIGLWGTVQISRCYLQNSTTITY